MQEPYKSYQKPYFPHCQVNGFVVFDEITNYVQRGHRGKDAKTVELLMSAAKQSRDGFEKTTNLPHIMAVMVPIAEGICDGSYGIAQPVFISRAFAKSFHSKIALLDVHQLWHRRAVHSPALQQRQGRAGTFTR